MFSRQALWPSAQASQLLPEPARPGDQQIAALGDPVAGGEFEEQRAVEPARALVIDVFDAGGMTQTRGASARFEVFLPAQRQFVFEQQAEPFGVIEAARLGFVFEFLEPLGEAIKTKRVQLIECRMSKHEEFLLNGNSRGRVDWRGRRARVAAVPGGRRGFAGEQRGDALAIERADLEGAGRDRFGARGIDAAIKLQNAQAGAKALFGMSPAGEHGGDQPLGVRPDLAGPAAEPVRRPLGVAPM